MLLFDDLIPFIDLMDLHGVATCCTGVVITNVVSMRSTIVKIVGPLLLVYRVGGGVDLLCGCLSLGHHVGWHHGFLCTLLHVIVKVCHIRAIPLHEVPFPRPPPQPRLTHPRPRGGMDRRFCCGGMWYCCCGVIAMSMTFSLFFCT